MRSGLLTKLNFLVIVVEVDTYVDYPEVGSVDHNRALSEDGIRLLGDEDGLVVETLDYVCQRWRGYPEVAEHTFPPVGMDFS
jgi:hypothetical protein